MIEERNSNFKQFQKLGTIYKDLQYIGVLMDLWKIGKQVIARIKTEGIYETLEYESKLEIQNDTGTKATFSKRKKIRYLQDNIIAYQDYGWGDGEILVDYQCSPGVPVDQYRLGHKTIILISLRREKNKGDLDEFYIDWKMKGGFIKAVEAWSTVVQHKTKSLEVKIIFPEVRQPHRVVLIENNRWKAQTLGEDYKRQLPDGRWQIQFKKAKPILNREYILEWEW